MSFSVGQAWAVLEGVYEAELVPVGVALAAILLDRLLKSVSLVTVFPETETRPAEMKISTAVARNEWKQVLLTKIVCLLEVHVDDATRPDRSHLGSKKSADFAECARLDLVAAVLGEKGRDRVGSKLLGARLVTRGRVAGIAAPRVDVVTPEVNGVGLVAAVEVVSHVDTNIGIVVGSVSDTDGTVTLLLYVGLGITDSSLDECTGVGVVGLVRDLVTSKETEDVGVVGQSIHHARVTG